MIDAVSTLATWFVGAVFAVTAIDVAFHTFIKWMHRVE